MMKKRLNFILILLIFTQFNILYAQYDRQNEKSSDTIVSDAQLTDSQIIELPETSNSDLLNQLEKWHVESFLRPEEDCLDAQTNPNFSDAVYEKRMQSLPFIIPMDYNETVRKCIDLYAGKLRNKMRYIMGMSYYYFPMMEQKLDAAGLPLELKYLSIVESALNPVAQSRVGAYGLWQFMLPTAKSSGLEINSLIDERLDPYRSTDAACIHLKRLYALFNDWHLVIAAYNCGEGNVLKAIRRSGGSRDFWEIYPYLPRETRSYLPLYMAAAYVMEYHCEHSICPVMPDFSVSTDTLIVERNLSFKQIADILHIDEEIVSFYNPQYKREVVPGSVKPSVLRLPMKNLYTFVDSEDEIFAKRFGELLAYCEPDESGTGGLENRKEKITHTVRSAENIYTIANLYGVKVQDLRKWNGLGRSTKLKAGRKLVVHVDNGGLEHTVPETDAKTVDNKQNTALTATTQSVATVSTESSAGEAEPQYISYKVKSGDTLSGIAGRYRGVTVKKIQIANGMKSTRLRAGQVIKIPQV
ncbi:MAG: LysM peptidoglycan-binding domain-containing protein [Tannerella sp.]|jgi:membrane-bound lytic murein transglycosylase D|nr:LysM peptidoglycan-binding domain-containing protein [Tannerella sp.]